MTRDHARKQAIRARMAASGEPYNTAARALDDAGPADEIIARVNNTLMVPRARAEVRMDWDITWSPRRPPGPVGRLAGLAAKVVWDRISPEDFGQRLKHPVGEGFIEPSADRYQIDFGPYAMMQFNGQCYRGASGSSLRPRHRSEAHPDEPLELLKRLRDVTDARHVGHETVRGAPCRAIAVRAGSTEMTVWIDHEHIRRVQTGESGSSVRTSASFKKTLELWDFGAQADPADWTHLPSFRTAGQASTQR